MPRVEAMQAWSDPSAGRSRLITAGLAQLSLQEVGLKAAFLLHGAGEEQTQRSTGTKEGIVCKDFLV